MRRFPIIFLFALSPLLVHAMPSVNLGGGQVSGSSSGGSLAIGDPVGMCTPNSVLFCDAASNLAQENPGFTYDAVAEDFSVSVNAGAENILRVYSGGVWINRTQGAYPFVVDGDGFANLLVCDPTAATVTVGGDLDVTSNTTLGDASVDSVTFNAASWSLPNDTVVSLGGGVDALNFDSNTLSIDATNNRVGVGTAAPVRTLQTEGDLGVVGDIDNPDGAATCAGFGAGKLCVNDAQGFIVNFASANRTTGPTSIQLMHVAGGVSGIGFAYNSDTNNQAITSDADDLTFWGDGDSDFIFQPGNTTRLTLQDTGQVQIASPDNTSGVFSIAEGANSYMTVNTTNGSERIVFNTTTVVVDMANDRVGIRTASPDATMHLEVTADNASAAEFRVQNNSTGTGVQSRQRFLAGGDDTVAGASAAAIALTNRTTAHFGTVPGFWISTERNTADNYDPAIGFAQHIFPRIYMPPSTSPNYGNLGVGTTTPTFGLHAAGTFGVNGNTTLGDASGDTVTSNAGNWTFANDTAVTLSGGVNGLNFDSNTLSIDATNNRVGIGTAAPLVSLDVAGDVLLGSTGLTSNVTLAGQTTVSMQDNAGARFLVTESTNNYFSCSTINGSEQCEVGESGDSVDFYVRGTGVMTVDAETTLANAVNTPSCTLDGAATSTCTITTLAALTCTCNDSQAAVDGVAAVAVDGPGSPTRTVTSNVTNDDSVVNCTCI